MKKKSMENKEEKKKSRTLDKVGSRGKTMKY